MKLTINIFKLCALSVAVTALGIARVTTQAIDALLGGRQ